MEINQIICNTGGANTGFGDCVLTLGSLRKAILVSPDFSIDPSTYATPELLVAALQTLAYADLPSDRIYPLPETVAITNNSEAVVTQTLGNGVPVVVRDGKINWTLQYTDGGNCLSNALRKFNRKKLAILFIDDNGVLFGTKVGTAIKGIPLDQFYANPFGVNDFANIANFSFQVIFSPNYINEDLGFVQLPLSSLLTLQGLQNINLKFVSRAANILIVQAVTGCSKENLYDEFSADLAQITNWIPRALNGNTIDVTAVAVIPNSKSFAITQDIEDPDYSQTAALTLELAAPSVLSGNDVPGYEGVKLNIPAV